MLASLVVVPHALADTPSNGSNVVSIENGTVTWGIKASWRHYNPDGTTLKDVTQDASGAYIWKIKNGTFNKKTKALSLNLLGTVKYKKYPTKTGYLIDVTFSEPHVLITPDKQEINAIYTGTTRENPAVVNHGRITIAKLNISNSSPSIKDGKTLWKDIPTNNAGWNLYSNGLAFDPMTISYDGPGAKPVVNNGPKLVWQGQSKYSLDSKVYDTGLPDSYIPRIMSLKGGKYFGLGLRKQVLGPLKDGNSSPMLVKIIDTGTMNVVAEKSFKYNDSIISDFASDGDSNVYFIGRDSSGKKYAIYSLKFDGKKLGDASALLTFSNAPQQLMWDPVRKKLALFTDDQYVPNSFDIQLIDPAKPKLEQWPPRVTPLGYQLQYLSSDLRNMNFVKLNSYFTSTPHFAVLNDGSYVWCGNNGSYSDQQGMSRMLPPFYGNIDSHIGSIWTSYLNQAVPFTPHDAANDGGDQAGYQSCAVTKGKHNFFAIGGSTPEVDTAPLGRVWSVTNDSPTVFRSTAVGDNYVLPKKEDVGAGQALGRRNSSTVAYFDRGSNSIFVYDSPKEYQEFGYGGLTSSWNSDIGSKFLDNGVIIADGINGDGHMVFWKINYHGRAPIFSVEPKDQKVDIKNGDAGTVVFHSQVAPTGSKVALQWQVQSSTSAKFVDIPGATGADLTVNAKESDNGKMYRVLANDGDRTVASSEAKLSVVYTPKFTIQPVSTTSAVGASPEFTAVVDSNPAATLTWQRYDEGSGLWIDIPASDSNFTVTNGENHANIKFVSANQDMRGMKIRLRAANESGTTYSQVAVVGVTKAYQVPAAGVDVNGVQLTWPVSGELQKISPAGLPNYLSAGASDGSGKTYKTRDKDVAIVITDPANPSTGVAPTFATKGDFIKQGKVEEASLTGGTGHVNADGSGTISWDGALSINFYGGLVPFTLSHLRLMVDKDGHGRLVADLSGYGSQMDNPTKKHKLAPVADQTVATFSGVKLTPQGRVTVTPDYKGVKVSVPSTVTQQDRSVADWGSWPQDMVDFQVKTGLSSYWYTSSAGDTAVKAPKPFVVDFTGVKLPQGGGEKPATPVAPTTVAPTPVAPTTVAPTPVAPPAGSSDLGGSFVKLLSLVASVVSLVVSVATASWLVRLVPVLPRR